MSFGSTPIWSSSWHFSNYCFYLFSGVILFPSFLFSFFSIFLLFYFPSFNLLKLKIKIDITPTVAIPNNQWSWSWLHTGKYRPGGSWTHDLSKHILYSSPVSYLWKHTQHFSAHHRRSWLLCFCGIRVETLLSLLLFFAKLQNCYDRS